jgi:hypothetical protein
LEEFIKNKKFEKANIKVWGDNIDGYSIYIPRFLQPLNPPLDVAGVSEGIDITKKSCYQNLARYVSLIPFKNDTQFMKH